MVNKLGTGFGMIVKCQHCGKEEGVYCPEDVLRMSWEGWEFTFFGNYCPSCECGKSEFVVSEREEGGTI